MSLEGVAIHAAPGFSSIMVRLLVGATATALWVQLLGMPRVFGGGLAPSTSRAPISRVAFLPLTELLGPFTPRTDV